MTSYYGGELIAKEGVEQPDSELKRMFSDLRYVEKDGKDCWTIDGIGDYCVGDDEEENEWWKCPGDTGYYYYIQTDGNNGGTVIPQVFKKSKFERIELGPTFDDAIVKAVLDDSLEENTDKQTLRDIYIENLFSLAIEWTAGFLKYFYDEVVGVPPVVILTSLSGTPAELVANQENQGILIEVAIHDENGEFVDTLTKDDFSISIDDLSASIEQATPSSGRYFVTFSVPALPVGFYDLSVFAKIDDQSDSSAWDIQTDAVVYKLPAPTNVIASDGESNRVHLSWTPVAGASFYRVYRNSSDNVANAVPLEKSWQEEVTYDDFSASSYNTYYYWVQAITEDLQMGFYSEPVTGWKKGALFTVTDKWSSVSDTYSIAISFSGILDYQVRRSTVPLLTYASVVKDYETSANPWVDDNVLPGKVYYYWVKEKGDSVLLGPQKGWAPFSVVTASQGDYPHKIEVSWKKIGWTSYYRVYRSTELDPLSAFPLGEWQTGTSYDDYDTEPGRKYYYWVKGATNSAGSNASQFSHSGKGWRPALPVPTRPSASGGTYMDKVRITWEASPGFDYYYRVYRGNCPNAIPLGEWERTTSFDDYTAIPGKSYPYCIKLSTSSEGTYSSFFSLQSEPLGYRMLETPIGLTASKNLYYCKVKLRWDQVPGAHGYNIYRSNTFDLSDAVRMGLSSETSYEDYSAECGRQYYYAIAAHDIYRWVESDFSTPVQGSHRIPAPTGVSASKGKYYDRVEIRWDSVPGIESYRVYRSTDNDFTTSTEFLGTIKNTHMTDYTASPRWQKYYYAVKAVYPTISGCESELSDVDAGWRLWEYSLTASDAKYADKVSLQWTDYGYYYRVFRHTENNSDDAIALGDWQRGGTYDERQL